VQRGASLARALGSADKLFPASVVETIAIAEETGRLDKELVRLAGAYEIDWIGNCGCWWRWPNRCCCS